MAVQPQQPGNQAPAAVLLWDPQPTIDALKAAKDVAVQASAVATLPAVQQLAATAAPSIPAQARDVVVAAGCAKVTEATQGALDGAIEECYAAPDGSGTQITRLVLGE